MREGLEPGSEMSDEMVTHFDRCLGCMACVTACPSGVQYDRLIERVAPPGRAPPPPAARRASAAPAAVRDAAPPQAPAGAGPAAGRVAPARGRAAARPAVDAGQGRAAHPVAETWSVPAERTPAVGEQRGRVGLLLGCVQRVFYPQVHAATVHALAAEGFEVHRPAQARAAAARCSCTAATRRARCSARGRRWMAFARAGGGPGFDHIVVNAAGCGSAMKDYGDLLDDPRGQGVLGPRPRRVRAARRDRAAGAPRAGAAAGRLPRRLPPRPRPGRAGPAPGSAGVDPGPGADRGGRRARAVLRLGRDLQPGPAAGGRRAGRAQGPAPDRDRRPGDRRRQPRAAPPSSTCTCAALGHPLPIHHPIELLSRSISIAAAGGA